MIAFRVDANHYTATGHAMRCMSIAEALIERGEAVLFIVADEDSRAFVAARGFPVEILNTNWQDMESELPVLLPLLDMVSPCWLVISGYQTTERYLRKVTQCVKTLFIDDLGDRVYPVSAVLNYNIYAQNLPYSDLYQGEQTEVLLGPAYAPLRKQFRQLPGKIPLDNSVLISVGGTDNYGMAQRIIEAAALQSECDGWRFHVLSGHFGTPIDIPESMADRVFIHKNVTQMAELMCSCRVAITAGGSTYYELCACGVPSVAYTLSDDQLPGAMAFDRLGAIPYCGDIRQDMEQTVQTLLSQTALMLDCLDVYAMRSTQMKKIVDGNGAVRIAEILTDQKGGI